MARYLSNSLIETLKAEGEMTFEHWKIPANDLFDWNSLSDNVRSAFYTFVTDECGWTSCSGITSPDELTYGMINDNNFFADMEVYLEGVTVEEWLDDIQYYLNCTYPARYDGKIGLKFLSPTEGYIVPPDLVKKDLGNGYITLYSPTCVFSPYYRTDNSFKITYTE